MKIRLIYIFLYHVLSYDKDCIEDLRVLFPCSCQPLVDSATNVRLKYVNVLTVYVDLQPIPFNKGFYSVDMTFFFDVCLDLFGGPTSCPVTVNGITIFNKKVILYGSEGSVKMFTSGDCEDVDYTGERVLPKATVQVADPVALSAKLCDKCMCPCNPIHRIPAHICEKYGSDFDQGAMKHCVYITIGLFTIVQIVRNVQMMIPAYDFCLPQKECVASSDNPCELFSKLDFPTDEFFPPKSTDQHCGC